VNVTSAEKWNIARMDEWMEFWSWPNDIGCEASTASIWRRSRKWRDGPVLARHGFPVSMIGSIRPPSDWREGSRANHEEVVQRTSLPFRWIKDQQTAASERTGERWKSIIDRECRPAPPTSTILRGRSIGEAQAT
jgi:hypothetical protein